MSMRREIAIGRNLVRLMDPSMRYGLLPDPTSPDVCQRRPRGSSVLLATSQRRSDPMAHPQHVTPQVLPDGEIRPVVRAPAVERWSWALYDFANTIFSMNVASLYFGVWLVDDLHSTNFVYALGNAIASVMVVIALPALGAVSDARRRRKKWVVGFTLASAVATVAIGVLGYTTMPLVGQEVVGAASVAAGWRPGLSDLVWVLTAFVLANFAYQAALPFYNAMLPELVPARDQG